MRRLACAAAAVVCIAAPAGSALAATPAYWDRPWAEHLLLVRDVVGVGAIVDARCTGAGTVRFSPAGVRRYRAFTCKVETNVGGRYPWVVVYVTSGGPSSFTARVD